MEFYLVYYFRPLSAHPRLRVNPFLKIPSDYKPASIL